MPEWTLVRLELAGTAEFPQGSASRAYMLRVPLDPIGLIDEKALAERPAMATVRRFWPNEADICGQLERNGHGWTFTCWTGGSPDQVYLLEAKPLRVGREVTITAPGGVRHPFRVVGLRPDGLAA